MSYRIEFLKEPTEEKSFCHTIMSQEDDLFEVEKEAFAHESEARVECGATGFQIRHINAVDRVVAIASFDDQLVGEVRD